MLDACARLLEESRYDEVTTTRIAQRAGVAIGSVYQFFPDKRAVAQALALRNLQQYEKRVTAALARLDHDHWPDALDVMIDEYVAMHRAIPGFRQLRFGDAVDEHLLDPGARNNAVTADRLRAALVHRFGLADTPESARAISVAVEACDAVLKLAFRRNPDGDPEIIAEAKKLTRRYLTDLF
jgi:AcrR family transcriptional regulator